MDGLHSSSDFQALQSLFIIKGFRTIVFIFIVISKRFGRYVLRTSSGVCRIREPSRNFIESTGVACSDSVSHNRVQVLSISVLFLACSQDWTCNLEVIVSLEA